MSEASHHRRIITATRVIWILCLVAVVAALGVVFETSRRVRIAEQAAIQQLKLVGEVRSKTESWLPSWLPLSELDAFQRVVDLDLVGERFNDANLVHLRHLKCLSYFFLNPVDDQRCPITDRGLANLVVTDQLVTFHVRGVQIGDGTLAHVTKSRGIAVIHMVSTGVSDKGVIYLLRCPMLQEVSFNGCFISDKAIPTLSRLQPGTNVDLRFTAVSDEGVDRLGAALRGK
jgi:hypothetical protein